MQNAFILYFSIKCVHIPVDLYRFKAVFKTDMAFIDEHARTPGAFSDTGHNFSLPVHGGGLRALRRCEFFASFARNLAFAFCGEETRALFARSIARVPTERYQGEKISI